MTDAEARKAVWKNVLGSMPAMLLMGLAAAGMWYEVHRLSRVWNYAAFLLFAVSALAFDAALLAALPRLRDVVRWPLPTGPQLMFPRMARSRPWIRAGVVLLAVGVVPMVLGFFR